MMTANGIHKEVTTGEIEALQRKMAELGQVAHLHLSDQTQSFGHLMGVGLYETPFFLGFSNLIPAYDARAAYLWVPQGTPEWRYAVEDTGLETCPIVYHPPLIDMLNGIFRAHFDAVQQLVDLPYRQAIPLEKRIDWVGTTFFCGGQPDEEDLTDQPDLVVTVDDFLTGNLLVEACSHTLGDSAGKLIATKIGTEWRPEQVLALRFGRGVRILDMDHPGNPTVNLLLCINQLLYPNYEIRKYRGHCTAETAYCITLAVHEWCTLERTYGRAAADTFFEPINTQTSLPAIDGSGFVLRWLQAKRKGGKP